jgi:hypothetical protein
MTGPERLARIIHMGRGLLKSEELMRGYGKPVVAVTFTCQVCGPHTKLVTFIRGTVRWPAVGRTR